MKRKWKKERGETQRFQTNETQQAPGELKDQIVRNDLQYSDDAHLLIEKDTHEQICERTGNYDIITETRELKIHWGELVLLKHTGGGEMGKSPPPFGQIK